MFVHAIIVNYQTPDELSVFLDSIVRNHEELSAKHEIVWHIVNAEPTERDERVVDQFCVNMIQVHSTAPMVDTIPNVGYAQAVNEAASGLRYSDVVVALNSDMRILDSDLNVFTGCVDLLYESPRNGIVGPRQVDNRGRITHGGIFGTGDAPRMRGWMQNDRGQYSDVAPAVTVSGSAFFVRRDCWNELTMCTIYKDYCDQKMVPAYGAFLPTRHYYEETACAYHARSHGWNVIYNGVNVLEHRWHRSSPVGTVEKLYLTESQAAFRGFCDSHNITHD